MQNKSNTPQKESYTSLGSANETHKEESTFINEEITGTPFILRGDENQGYVITMGDYRITQLYKTKEEPLNEIAENQWTTVLTMISICLEINEKSTEKTNINS